MEDLLCLLFLLLSVIVHQGKTDLPLVSLDQLCQQVRLIDCDTEYVSHGDEQTCGMNGITYDNFKARCSDANLGIANVGSCIGNDPRSTLPPDYTSNPNFDVIIQFFCRNADTIDCALEDHEPHCNGLSCKDMCELAKAKCTEPTLDSQSLQLG